MRTVRQIVSDHQQLVVSTRQLLVSLAHCPTVINHDGTHCSELCKDILEGQSALANLGAYDVEGNIICSGIPLGSAINSADLPYFRRAVRSGEFSASNFHVGRVHGRPAINFAYPVSDNNGKVSGRYIRVFGSSSIGPIHFQDVSAGEFVIGHAG